jgi:hypothetical protein
VHERLGCVPPLRQCNTPGESEVLNPTAQRLLECWSGALPCGGHLWRPPLRLRPRTFLSQANWRCALSVYLCQRQQRRRMCLGLRRHSGVSRLESVLPAQVKLLGWSALTGGSLFELGAVAGVMEAINTGRTTNFGHEVCRSSLAPCAATVLPHSAPTPAMPRRVGAPGGEQPVSTRQMKLHGNDRGKSASVSQPLCTATCVRTVSCAGRNPLPDHWNA